MFTERTVLPLSERSTSPWISIPALFIFHLFRVILWFWSWVCLTFSSPWVRGILHSVSLYPQPPAARLNQKQRQPRRWERANKGRQSVVIAGLHREWETEDMEGKWSKCIHFQNPHSNRLKNTRQTWAIIFKLGRQTTSLRFETCVFMHFDVNI